MQTKFLYGAATSAHQVEGNNVNNDWWAWEQRRRAAWRSGRACDHYRLFAADIQLARELGHNAHRLSLEWSRIEPQRGVFNRRELDHYRQVLTAIKQAGMEPMVTLWHFTLPQWLARQGGWAQKESAERFKRYVEVVMNNLGELAELWITLNEPMVYVSQSYWQGIWPPQRKNGWLWWQVINNLTRGHRGAYRVIKRQRPTTQVGVANNFIVYQPQHEESRQERWAAQFRNWWFNWRFLNMTAGSHDFIGVNYYMQYDLTGEGAGCWPRVREWPGQKTDLGWPVRPDGLSWALTQAARRYRRPLYVTENGLADANDDLRAQFIRDHLRAVETAQKEGADVRGYFHWSLMDNFEWAEGFKPRFGLVEVDYATMERKVRPSAYVYRGIIEGSK